MSHKRIVWTLLVTAMLVISATVSQAQSSERPVEEGQTTTQDAQAAAQGGFLDVLADILARQKEAVVGTWLVTLGNGSKGLITFHADGTVIYSTQGEVSIAPNRPSHTSLHGVWKHLGGRQFGYTVWDIWYDVNTAQLIQFGKLRGEVTLGDDREEGNVRAKLEFFNPQGDVILSREGTANFKRIKYEPLD